MKKGLKILLVDSDSVMIAVIKLFLEKSLPAKSEIATARSCKEALMIFKEKDFDVVVSALLLEKEDKPMDGVVLLKGIKSLKPITPVIAFISTFEENIEEECLEAGFDAYLSKIHPDKLPQIILDSLPQVGG